MEEKIQKSDANILVNTDNVLVVKPLTLDGYKYYGLNTEWIESIPLSRYEENNISSQLSGGEMYFILDKKTNEKFGIYQDNYGQFWEGDGEEVSKKTKNKISSILGKENKKIYNNIFGSKTFKLLRRLAGKEITQHKVQLYDSSIYKIDFDNENPLDSKVIIDLDESDGWLSKLNNSDDEKWFIKYIMNRDYDFTDGDREWDELMNGYGLFGYFNGFNEQKLNQIADFLLPNEKFDLGSEKYVAQLARELYDSFGRELDKMMYTLIEELNEKASEDARQSIKKEISEILGKYGFDINADFDTISITLGNLITLYLSEFKVYDKIGELIDFIFSKQENEISAATDYYEYLYNSRIDSESINNEFESELNDILEKISEDEKFREKMSLTNRVREKFDFNKKYTTKFSPKLSFEIIRIDDDYKILVRISDGQKSITHGFSEEEFYKFINNPRLFDIFDE